MLAESFQIEHLVVQNGGEFLLPNATEKANIVSAYIRSDGDSQTFSNCTVSSSAGWGIVVEPDTWDFKFEDPSKNNTFESNTIGDVPVLT